MPDIENIFLKNKYFIPIQLDFASYEGVEVINCGKDNFFGLNEKMPKFADLIRDGLVVQLVRIRACHARGRGFESRPDRQRGLVLPKA